MHTAVLRHVVSSCESGVPEAATIRLPAQRVPLRYGSDNIPSNTTAGTPELATGASLYKDQLPSRTTQPQHPSPPHTAAPPQPPAAASAAGASAGVSGAAAAVQQLVSPPAGGLDQLLPVASDLQAAACHFHLVSLVLLVTGAALTAAPAALLQAATHAAPSMLDTTFARLMGVALLYRAAVAHVLAGAATSRRLGSTSAQRVMLGALLPALAHLMAFHSAWAHWGAAWSPRLMALYPAVLLAEFVTYISTFQAYNPYFLLKLFWPIAVAYFVSHLLPPPPTLHLHLAPKVLSPLTAGMAYMVGVRGAQVVARVAAVATRVTRRAVFRYLRKQLGSRSFRTLVPRAGPPLTETVVSKMDYMLPQSPLGWGYWGLMMTHFATMFCAYRPETLFRGEASPITPLLKQTWSAGFLAAAFSCDALKTAADRQHLGLAVNRPLNLALLALEGGLAAVLAWSLGATGVVAHSTTAYLRLATSGASILFLLAAQHEAEHQSRSPPTTSLDWQQALERRPGYHRVMAAAVLVLNVITCCI